MILLIQTNWAFWCWNQMQRNLFNMIKTCKMELGSNLSLKNFNWCIKKQVIYFSYHVLKGFLSWKMRCVTLAGNRLSIIFFFHCPNFFSSQLRWLRVKCCWKKLNLGRLVQNFILIASIFIQISYHFVKFSNSFFFQILWILKLWSWMMQRRHTTCKS